MFRTVVKQFSYVCDKCIPSNQIIKRYAGHSKWQNIRHIKADQDAERALRFTKLGRLMKVAVAGELSAPFVLRIILLIF